MVAVYEDRMVPLRSPGRRIYDTIIGLPKGGICPFCAHGLVSTLDHVMPKAHFCELAVTPDNLVGACRDCNDSKGATAPTSPEEVPVHPYFDEVSGKRWLDARVVEDGVAAVVFRVVAVDAWDDNLNKRIKHQFDVLNLGRLYALQAATEISGLAPKMAGIYNKLGTEAVQRELLELRDSWARLGVNRWQAATFRALAGSEWYCAGGFRCE